MVRFAKSVLGVTAVVLTLLAPGNAQAVASYSAHWAGQSPFPTIGAGTSAPVSIDFTNTGSQVWNASGANPVHLATSHPRDRRSGFASSSWLAPNRPATFANRVNSDGSLTPTTTISPGETARFPFSVTAPANLAPGTYNEYFQLVTEGVTFMEDQGVYIGITVAPAYDFQYAGQSAYPNVARNSQSVLTLNLKNTGSQTWNSTGSTPLHLATARPTDRGSGFATIGSGGWLSPNRIHLTSNLTDPSKNIGGETTVLPGQTGQFSFTITAAPPAGTYPEYFRPVIEGVAFLRDIGIFWNITVH